MPSSKGRKQNLPRKISVPEPRREILEPTARLIGTFGRIYNGFEMHGTENLPQEGGALAVFYHGAVPVDIWYMGMQVYLQTGRYPRGLGDRFLFALPYVRDFLLGLGGVPGDPDTAVQMLRDGYLVGVSPGGVREALAGAEHEYKLIWGKRQGFARVALQANVPLIPVFTENIEQSYRVPFAHLKFFQNLYERTRLPLQPIVGLGILPLPVKLRSWVGKPIRPRKGETPAQLAARVKRALEKLIDEHQKPGQTVIGALRERFLPGK